MSTADFESRRGGEGSVGCFAGRLSDVKSDKRSRSNLLPNLVAGQVRSYSRHPPGLHLGVGLLSILVTHTKALHFLCSIVLFGCGQREPRLTLGCKKEAKERERERERGSLHLAEEAWGGGKGGREECFEERRPLWVVLLQIELRDGTKGVKQSAFFVSFLSKKVSIISWHFCGAGVGLG